MQLKDFVVQPCKSRMAFEFLPKKKDSLDLEKIAAALRQKGVEIEVQTPFVLVVNFNHQGASIFKSGKIIMKDCQNEEEARKTAESLIQKMGHGTAIPAEQ
jgi:TATA-box binding protein (TBP) (component of TFIID and TFIIIB)